MEWFGVLPERWDKKRVGVLFTENTQNNSNLVSESPLQFRFGEIIKKKQTEKDAIFLESIKRYIVVAPNDIMVNGLNLNYDFVTQRVAIVKENGCMTPAYISLRPKNQIVPEYACYLLKTMDAQKLLNGLGTGIRLTLSYSELKKTFLPLPPREEQDQIVRFLDWKVSQINKLINAKKKQIAFLQEQKKAVINQAVTKGLDPDVEIKDSGVDYIGQIPKHWVVLQNRRLYKENVRAFNDDVIVLSLSQKDGLIPYEVMKERSLHTASYDNWKFVHKNDLVVNRFKAHLGVFFSSKYEGIVTFHYGVFEPKMALNSKYYEALYHTSIYRNVYAGRSNGMTVGLQNLSNMNFYSVYTIYPPHDEQDKIVAYIDEIEMQSKKAEGTIEREITLLHEYRTRLISDVVTGKLDVRNVEIPDYEAIEELTDTTDIETDELGGEDNAD